MSVESLFLECAVNNLQQLAGRIEVCLGKLNDDQIWARGHENENAIGNLVLHLTGNVRQWIIASLGNQPDARHRDGEFAARGSATTADLSAGLRATIDEATRIIAGLTADRLEATYEIQKYSVSGVQAVFHVVEHFAQHTGQIIFATKMLTGEDLGFYAHLNAATHNQRTP
jgi:uncharacterized damage-inducible protein DinB